MTDQIIQRIQQLERNADLNNDGVVTKEEYQQYTAMQSLEKDRKISRLQAKLDEEREKVKAIQGHYQELQVQHQALLERLANDRQLEVAQSSQISSHAIDRFVDELLADPQINIYWLHDRIERPIYRNMLTMMLTIMQRTLNSASLNVIGHEFRTSMQPSLETKLAEAAASSK